MTQENYCYKKKSASNEKPTKSRLLQQNTFSRLFDFKNDLLMPILQPYTGTNKQRKAMIYGSIPAIFCIDLNFIVMHGIVFSGKYSRYSLIALLRQISTNENIVNHCSIIYKGSLNENVAIIQKNEIKCPIALLRQNVVHAIT